jgi:anti-sigma regulatory factor (Ser/Thr protein kinase)
MMLPPHQEEHPAGTPRIPLNGGSIDAPPQRIAFVLGASWVSASIARERVSGWLRALAWPESEREDIVLVANEAVSNAIEHGYEVRAGAPDHPGTIAIEARVELLSAERRQVVLTVRDHGRWKARVGGDSAVTGWRSCRGAVPTFR